jgi:NitT/TauT family transport system ATP-binding protein
MPKADRLREILARGDWGHVASLLRRLAPPVAADVLMSAPPDQQAGLFGRLPVAAAAKVASVLPYYDAYVLLHSRPLPDLRAIVNEMDLGERLRFLDELPEAAWQRLMDELGETQPADVSLLEPGRTLPPVIEARQIEKSYTGPGGGPVQVIAPTDLAIETGLILAVLGPSGCGKSTLLRILSGLAAPTKGDVLWHGEPLNGAGPNVAIVFQSFALFPWLTVVENVEVPLLARGIPRDERRQRAQRTLNAVGLKGFETAYPKELSGGMKQRVGLARALAVEPEVLFMDEPFSALDVLTAENLRGELLELWLDKKIQTKSIFLVTHNIEEAVLLADRVIVLGRNPAHIRADFRIPAERPRDRTSAEFLFYVDYIYKLLTQPEIDAPAIAQPGAKARYQMLPHARRGSIAGLLELLNDRGKEDLYRIAEELRMEIDDLLPVVEAAALLSFARSAQGDVEITPAGKAFAVADIHERKRLFREAALACVVLLQQMDSALASKSDHTMPLEFFRDLLREHFSHKETERQIETALNWGRYGDVFTYDSESDRLTSHQPSVSAESRREES